MNQEETLQGNTLIASFMGMEQGVITYPNPEASHHGIGYFNPSELNYHRWWDALMPVVEKIESLNVHFQISGNSVNVGTPSNGEYYWQGGITYDSKIISTWHGVVQFIKWYNNQKKQ